MRRTLSVLVLAAACGGRSAAPAASAEPAAAPPASPPPATAPGAKDPPAPDEGDAHGTRTPLGAVSVGGWTFELALLGTLTPGHEAAIEARATTVPPGRDWKTVGAYLWVEDATQNPVSAPAKPVVENGQLHFHANVEAGAAVPASVVLRVREEGRDARARLALTAHGVDGAAPQAHTHEKTPHDGLLVAWTTGGDAATSGFAEVKLHDDQGDLEVWLARDRAMTQPLRLPVTARPTLTLVDLGQRVIPLAPRDAVTNPDEVRGAHIVSGAGGPETDYFVFPGTTGADASALRGKAFSSVAVLRFELAGRSVTSEEVMLQPHTHGPGGAH